MRRLITAFGAAVGLSLALTAPASAATAHQTTTVHDLQQGLSVVDGAAASLVRGPGGLSMNIQTTGLHGGHAYTVWWIVFNNPERCANPMGLPGLRCGFYDLNFPEFGLHGDPAVNATIVRATGGVVGPTGKAGFGAHLSVDDHREPVLGDGLQNVDGSEVILDMLDHGTKDPGNIPAQIHQFVTAENSCNPGCLDHQLAGFAP